MSSCGEVRILLGVYVLGAIEPAERGRVEAHLGRCPACRDELAGLAGLPALLGRVEEAQLAQVSGASDAAADGAPDRSADLSSDGWPGRSAHRSWHEPSEEPLERLLGAAAARRPGRTRRWTAQAAAAVLILMAGVAGGVAAGGDAGRPAPPSALTAPAVEQVSATDPQTHVSAQLGINGKAWGTAVTVRLKGAPPGTRCRLMAVGKDGRRDIAAGWQVVYTGIADFQGSTMISRDQLRAFEISTVDGRRLLTVMSPP